MIGIGQSLTSGPVLLRLAGLGGVPPVLPYALQADDAIEATLDAAKDGVRIVVTAPARFAGTYDVAAADIASGRPVWLVAPTVAEVGPRRWAVRDDGLLLHPEDGPAVVHVGWERNGEAAGIGESFAADGPGQTDAEVAMRVRASNVAGSTDLRVVVAAAVRYVERTVVFTGAERVGGSLAGTPATPRLALLWSGVLPAAEAFGVLSATRTGGGAAVTFGSFRDSGSGQSMLHMMTPVRRADGTVSTFLARNTSAAGRIPPGSKVTCLALYEAGQRPILCVSVDGRPFGVDRTFHGQPAGSTIPLDYDRVVVGNTSNGAAFRGRMSCLRLWAPGAPLAGLLDDAGFLGSLTDVDGVVKPASQQAPYLGAPLLDLSGDAAAYMRGDANAGTAGPFAVTAGRIEDFIG